MCTWRICVLKFGEHAVDREKGATVTVHGIRCWKETCTIGSRIGFSPTGVPNVDVMKRLLQPLASFLGTTISAE